MKTIHLPPLLLIISTCLFLFEPAEPIRSRAVSAKPAAAQNVTLRSSGTGYPWINLQDGRDFLTEFQTGGAASLIESDAEPLVLSAGDFDEDGVPDLLSGYAAAGQGFVTIYRGNADAIYPNSPGALARKRRGIFTEAPFLSPASVVESPGRPDLLGAGDFNADGHQDLLAATIGIGALYWAPGAGNGSFLPFEELNLSGNVTALATGDVNRADGLTDVIVGIAGGSGPQLLVFEGPEGALKCTPETIPVPEILSSLTLGRFDTDSAFDIAAASGHHLLIAHGRDRRLSSDQKYGANAGPARIDRIEMPFRIASLATGNYSGDANQELAVLSDTGVLEILNFQGYPVRSGFTLQNRAVTGIAGQIRIALSSPRQSTVPRLIHAKVSSRPYDDLIVLDPASHQIQIVMGEMIVPPRQGQLAAPIPENPVTLESDAIPVSLLPMRLNPDGLSDLVVLKRGGSNPIAIIATTAVQTFTVNSDIQYQDYNPGDGKCETPPYTGSVCTLVAAIQEANASPGADQINFSINKMVYGTIFGGGGTDINESVTIDGTSQGHVEIYGEGHTVGLSVGGTNSVVRGMALNKYSTKAFSLWGSGNMIEGNYVGTDRLATQVIGNSQFNIYVTGSNHTIGGATAAAGNLVSGATNTNVAIETDINDNPPSGNKVQGNYIGTDVNGAAAMGATYLGISVTRGINTQIGGSGGSAGNLIAGNRLDSAISIWGGEGALIQGNRIGTDAQGMAALGAPASSAKGIVVGSSIEDGVTYRSQKNTIGGTSPAARNLISASPSYGITIYDAKENLIQNNLIGTNLAGTAALGNSYGIQIFGAEAQMNTIGGLTADARNVVSGNKNIGIVIYSNNNSVRGNYIGTQIDGTKPLKNGSYGIGLLANAASNIIGGISANAAEKPGNLIAFNGSDGVYVEATATKNKIRGNSIFDNDGLGIRNANSSAPQPPVISVTVVLGKPELKGSISGNAGTVYRIEYFGNEACDPSGSGEGRDFLGFQDEMTDASGNAAFTAPFNPPSGVIMTATVTPVTEGTTSQFSVCSGTAGDNVMIENPKVDGNSAPNDTLLPRPSTPLNLSFVGDLRFRLISDNQGGFLTVAAYDVSIPGNPLSLQQPNGQDARLVIPVQMSPAEQVQKDVQLDVRIPSVSTKFQIRVGLFDSNTSSPTLLAVDAIEYPRSNVKIEFGTRRSGEPDATFYPWPGTQRLLANYWIDDSLDLLSDEIMFFRVTYDLSSANGKLYLERLGKKKDVPLAVGATSTSENITGGRQKQVYLYVNNLEVLANSDFWEWRAHIVADIGSEDFYSDPEKWTIDRLKLLASSPPTRLSYTRGNDVEVGYSLEYNVDRGASRLTGVVQIEKEDGTSDQRLFTLADYAAGAHGVTPPGTPGKFSFTLPVDAVSFKVFYSLSSPPDCDPDKKGCDTYTRPVLNYNKIASPAIEIPAGITGAASALGVDLTNVQNQINRTEKIVRNAGDIISTALSNPRLVPFSAMAQAEATGEVNPGLSGLENLIGVNAVWQFDPPIPADGTFGADLTIHYAARDLPDDPNFNEANLKLVAFYPETGRLEILPTTLDTANKKATTRVSGLASYYTLAVTGPFPARRLNYPVINSSLSPGLIFINPAAGSANLTVSDYGPGGFAIPGIPAPVNFSIPSLSQVVKAITDLLQLDNDGGWMQATSTTGPMIGYESIGDSGRQDGLAVAAVNWPRLVLPEVEYDSAWTTELHLANTSNFDSNLQLELRNSNGSTAGTYDTWLGAKGALTGAITDIFPNLTAPFRGYLLVSADQRLAAAGLLVSTNSIATTGGQLWQNGSDTPAKLYAPQVLSGSGGMAELTLVNPTNSAAALTLRLLNETGTNLATPVTRTLNAGEQLRLDVGQLFGLNPNSGTTGGIVVESSMTGIAGELSLRDTATGNMYRTILPLETVPARSVIFAQVSNQPGSFTRLSFFDPGEQQANIMVKVMRADGSEAGNTSLQLPAKGAVTRLLTELVGQSADQNSGYVMVTADQPIIASGTFGPTDKSGLSALPAQPVESTLQACTAFASLSSTSGVPGGTVTITGTGFSGVSSVKFFNHAPAAFTINSDTSIKATVPATAATGPIAISKPGCTDVLTTAYTVNTAACVKVYISNTLTGPAGGSLTAPVTVSDLTGKGVIAYDAVIDFDPAVLRPQSTPVDTAGTISTAMAITTNANLPGQIRISAFGPQPLSGAGALLNLRFDVIGNVSACSDLSWSLIRFNEGDPCVSATNGRACATGKNITGAVLYCASPTSKPVPGVTISLTGAPGASTTTDPAGNYLVGNLGSGPYTVTPSKSGDAFGISSYDAALTAQNIVGLISLTECQRIAADASNDGSLSSFDAAMIGQYSAGISNPQSIAGTWKFTPATRSYPTLTADQSNQNFNAILVGDVSGNWAPVNLQLSAGEGFMPDRDSAVIYLPEFDRNPEPGSRLIVPINIVDLTRSEAISYDFELAYEKSVLKFQDASFDSAGTLSRDMAVTVNHRPGSLRVSAFGTSPLKGPGTLLNLRFKVIGKPGRSTTIELRGLMLNEAPQTRLQGSRLTIGRKKGNRQD